MHLEGTGIKTSVWETQRLDDPRRLKILRLGVVTANVAVASGIAGVIVWFVRVVSPHAWRYALTGVTVACLVIASTAYVTCWVVRVYVARADRLLTDRPPS